ncbi:hypothetical protein T439DRAFT_321586 [Meredithblackwellia eburnea MCA 4105]
MSTKPRRSSRQSTPTSPPSTGSRKGALPVSASTPSISSLVPPPSATRSRTRSSMSPAPPTPGAASRPALPKQHANTLMDGYKGKLHKVKVQVLTLGPTSTITIARVKCPVPKGVPGHIIKRFDTNAVSASSLFRAAFPTATDTDEEVEMKWISKGCRGKYGDTHAAGLEHDETKKLSGTWIPVNKAAALAREYSVLKFAQELIDFTSVDNEPSMDSEADSPAPVKSPRSKRARVGSPIASTPTPKSALSGASANGVSILQTLSTDAATGITTQTAEVKVDVPVNTEVSNGLVASDEAVAEQIEAAKKLVETLKEAGALKDLAESTEPVASASKKRALEEDEDDAPLPESGTMADLIDNRGFFGKIFRRAPRRVPRTAGREIKPVASAIAVAERRGERRWVAGVGLALAVGATAAAPFFFG